MNKRLAFLIGVVHYAFLIGMNNDDGELYKAVQKFRAEVSHFNSADLPAPFDEENNGFVLRMEKQEDGSVLVNTHYQHIYLFDKENGKWGWLNNIAAKENTDADRRALRKTLEDMPLYMILENGTLCKDIPQYRYNAKSGILIYPHKASLALCTPFLSTYIDAPNPHASCFIQDSALNKDGTCAACLWTTEDKFIRNLNGIADSALCSRQLLLAHVADRSLCLTWHDLQQVRDDAKHQLFFDTKNRMHLLTVASDRDVTHSIGVAPYQTLTHHESWLDVGTDETVNSKDPISMGFVSNFPGLSKELLSSQPYIEWDEQSKLPTLALLTWHLVHEHDLGLPEEIVYKIMATYRDVEPKAVGKGLTFIYGSVLSAQEKRAAKYLQWASELIDTQAIYLDYWPQADEWNAVKHAVAWEEVTLEKTNGMTGEKKWIKTGEKVWDKLFKESGASENMRGTWLSGYIIVSADKQKIEIALRDGTTIALRSSLLEYSAALMQSTSPLEFAQQCTVQQVQMPDDDTIMITLHNKEQLIAKKDDAGKWYRDF